MKKSVFAGFALIVALGSCQKETEGIDQTSMNQAQSFEELQVSHNFNWSTETNYQLELKGLDKMPFAVKKQLSIESLNGEILHTALAEISEDRIINFKSQAGLNTVLIKYGSITKESSLNQGAFHFDFIPVDDTSDLDPNDQ